MFKFALLVDARSVILSHNHPSGNPEPSREDVAVTKQLVEAGKVMGIPVHDHLILAGRGYMTAAALRSRVGCPGSRSTSTASRR